MYHYTQNSTPNSQPITKSSKIGKNNPQVHVYFPQASQGETDWKTFSELAQRKIILFVIQVEETGYNPEQLVALLYFFFHFLYFK